VESFNGKLRHKLLAREAFDTLLDAKVLIELWRHHCNTIRPHSALAHRPPAPEARQPCAVISLTLPFALAHRPAISTGASGCGRCSDLRQFSSESRETSLPETS
jgi:hypothetical protein